MKVELYIHTNKVGSECRSEFEIDKEEWENMEDHERDGFMLDCLFDSGMFEWGWDVHED